MRRKLISYLKPYWYFALLAPLFMVGEVVCDLMQPTLMSKIVDEGVLGGNMELIIRTGLMMIGIAITGGVAGVGAGGFSGAASQSFGNDLRKDLYERIMSLSLEQTDRFTTGSLITRLTNDITMVQNLVEMALRMFVRSPLMFLGGIFMALSLNVNFAVVIAISLPIQLLTIFLVLAKASPLFTIVQDKLDKVNSVVQENVSGARVVKAYVREDYEEARFDKANMELVEKNLKVQKLIAILNPVLMIVMNLSVIAIIYIGGWQVEAGKMQVGVIMAAVTYITQVLMSVMMVSMMFQSISRGRASAQRIRDVLNTEPTVVSGGKIADFTQGKIQFDHVSFAYPTGSGRQVLTDIDFTIEGGQTIAVLGATGAGKSTLVNLISRFYDPDQGGILIDGEDIRHFTLESLRDNISMVLQKSELFSGSIQENICWGKEEATAEDVREAARIAQAEEFISKFQEGYASQVGEKGTALSGGQKQRLCIARAIVRKPRILIFDDSTSALDLTTEAKLRKALKENLQGTTVIMIAQRVASVKDADKIAVIDKGRLVAYDCHDRLMENCPVYIDIYNSQNKGGECHE